MKGVLRLCKDAMKSKITWDWLFVLPLCHFLSGACQPFASPNLYPKRTDFNATAQQFGYDEVLKKKSLQGYISYYTLNYNCGHLFNLC